MPQVLSGHHTLLLCPPRLSLPPLCPRQAYAEEFVSKQVLLIEAWRHVQLEVADDHGLHGRRIAEQVLEEQPEVAAALARLEEEAEGRFRLDARKAEEGMVKEIKALLLC